MQIAAIFLLALSSPWMGLWRIAPLPGAEAKDAQHLIVRADLSVELYAPDWSGFQVRETKWDGDQLFVRYTMPGHTKNYDLKVERTGENFKGQVEMLAQFKVSQAVSAIRVSPLPPPNPVEWIASKRIGNRIDVLGFILERAPRESFDGFLEFWRSEIAPAYYIYLHDGLYGLENDAEKAKSKLKRLFQALPKFSLRDLTQLEGQLVKSALGTASEGTRSLIEKGGCRAIVPSFNDSGVRVTELAVEKIAFKEAKELCCGAKAYKMENFLLVRIAPDWGDERSPPKS